MSEMFALKRLSVCTLNVCINKSTVTSLCNWANGYTHIDLNETLESGMGKGLRMSGNDAIVDSCL